LLKQEEIKSLFEKKQYFEVLQESIDDESMQDFLGFLYLENKDYVSAEKYFAQHHMAFQQGFCRILQGDKAKARTIWYMAKESTAIVWGKVLLGILDQRLEAIPTFLQVRNFLEMTLHYLFKSGQSDFAYKLISAKEFFADCNIEAYKYIGRVLMDNGEEEIALEYLQKAIDIIPQDYEAYFYLGELYLRNDNIQKAVKSYKRVLELNPYHTPAAKILKKIAN
jgi:tetratricopeptide (TPR) repeat protein